MDLTEAEEIKKRWQDYTENLYKKDHHLSPESWAGRKAFGYYPEEESFAVSGQMGGVRWNQLAEKKGENSEFQFSKQRLFFFF